jgi:hypothetical protein
MSDLQNCITRALSILQESKEGFKSDAQRKAVFAKKGQAAQGAKPAGSSSSRSVSKVSDSGGSPGIATKRKRFSVHPTTWMDQRKRPNSYGEELERESKLKKIEKGLSSKGSDLRKDVAQILRKFRKGYRNSQHMASIPDLGSRYRRQYVDKADRDSFGSGSRQIPGRIRVYTKNL